MYSSENSSFDIKDIIVKILFLVFFVLILMWLYPKMPDFNIFTDRIYNENINAMKDAALDYYTIDRLPKNVGDVSEMTLQKMFDLKLLVPFVDKDGRSCDTYNSYVQVTREEKEYVMKVTLVCGRQDDYIVEYIGCHDVCTSLNCKDTDTKDKTNTTTKPQNNTNNNNNNGGNGGTSTVTTKYTVNVKAVNGSVANSKLVVAKGKTASTTVKPNSGYKYASVSCTNGQTATWSNNTIKVKKVTKSTTCTVKFTKNSSNVPDTSDKYTVKVAVVNGTSSDRSKEVNKGADANFTITANTGYDVNNSAVTCSSGTVASMSGSKLTFKAVKQDGTCVVTIGKKSYDKYTVNLQVVNGKSNVSSKTVAPNSSTAFTITPNSGYTLTNATVSCGNGLKPTLTGTALTVTNIKSSGSCVVVLKETSKYLYVTKTYYSTGYVYNTGIYTYGVYLGVLPNHVTPGKVVATGVDIRPMETYSDFQNYVAGKKAGEVIQPNGENGYSVKSNTAATLQAHALTKSNFATSAVSGCNKTRCSVVITNNVKNLNGVTPTGTVTFVNDKKGSGLYYVPVKFIVTFKYEK